MPLPSDEKLIALGNEFIALFDSLFGLHPGFRPAHAKGILLRGTFTPTREAASLTRAPHATRESTPVLARFSDSTGLPAIPDNDPNANPRGLAIRFSLAEHVHTDIVSHSTDGFPTRTGEEFLEFLRAVVSGKPEPFLATHPAALAFVQTPKLAPASFATEAFFGLTAMRFTNAEGVSRYGRYRIVPDAGVEHLDDEAAKSKDSEFLFTEIAERLANGPAGFRIEVQVANDGDVTDDPTSVWPPDRTLVPLGTVELTALAPEQAQAQKLLMFDPLSLTEGIEPSADPVLLARPSAYGVSFSQRIR